MIGETNAPPTSKTFTRRLDDYPRASEAVCLTQSHKSDVVISRAGEAVCNERMTTPGFSFLSGSISRQVCSQRSQSDACQAESNCDWSMSDVTLFEQSLTPTMMSFYRNLDPYCQEVAK